MGNYCTLFPEGNWSLCCKKHDNQYTAQGNKLKADFNFSKCVFKKVLQEPIEALLSFFVFILEGFWILFSIIVALFFFLLVYVGVSTVGCYFYFRIYFKRRRK